MEESTNTFTGGLNQDLNPIATPDNVLTDAKNATFITFNGNEMSLQNDMGNTKITYTDPLNNTKQSVTLPKGYVPIGVKEYGGILYIVSKNPSTNQVEIGSFPSPEFVSQEDGKPLSIKETEITDDDGVFLKGPESESQSKSESESGIFDITTEILHPCDIIKDYSFFPLNFETISTENERRLFKYKLINSSTRKDITNLSPPFNLSSKVWYKTLQLTKNNVWLNDVIVTFPNNMGTYTYYKHGKESGTKPDEFTSYQYEVNGELRLSMYYEGVKGIKYTLDPRSSGKKRFIQPSDKEITYPQYDFEYGGDGIYYFPNLQSGAISFKFYTETIDYFNLHRIEDQIVKYSPELVKDAFKFNDDVIDEMTELFGHTFFDINEDKTITPKQFTSPNNTTGNTILPYASNKYSLQICSDKGAIYTPGDYSIEDESKRFMTISYINGEFKSQVEINNQEYFLKFNKIKIEQDSWVKVNKIIFSYEVYHNDNLSKIIDSGEQVYDNVNIINEEWNVPELCSISIPGEETEIKVGAFIGKDNSYRYLGTVEGENIKLSHFSTFKISNISGQPNYTVKFSFTPYNTDYNIDISQFKIDRTIDLTKSPDSWEGNLVFKENEELINVSLDNCLIRYKWNYQSLWNLKDQIADIDDKLHDTYIHDKPMSVNDVTVKKKYTYNLIRPTFDNIQKDSKVYDEYVVPPPDNKIISPLKYIDSNLQKYFTWSGKVSPAADTSYGHEGDVPFVNYGNYDYFTAYNILNVDGKISETSKNMEEDDMCRLDPPNSLPIGSDESGTYDVSKIKRSIKTERLLKNTKTTQLSVVTRYDGNNVKYPIKLGYSIKPEIIKYNGSKSYSSKYSKLYYIRKNAQDTPCDSFGKVLINSEFIPEYPIGFNNIFNIGNDPGHLYTSVVPIKSDVLSRALIQQTIKYTSNFTSEKLPEDSKCFTFAFYLSSNFEGELMCNADILKIHTDQEILEDDSILFDEIQYNKSASIKIKSGTKKYTRVVLICKSSTLSDSFYFTFIKITPSSKIYNPILYNSKLINITELSADCVDLRGQGMLLTTVDGSQEYVGKQFGSINKLSADYVPLPFYEIIN